MKHFKKWIKKIFSFIFGRKNKVTEELIEKPVRPFKMIKREVIHKILPNYFTMPTNFSFRRGKGNVQQIVRWDGEHFPGRWRTNLIYHK